MSKAILCQNKASAEGNDGYNLNTILLGTCKSQRKT